MATLILFNKPFNVLSQFTDLQLSEQEERATLAHYIDVKGVYPAGRLDRDSEGLLLLTDDGKLQHWIAGARDRQDRKQAKHYWVQVEGKLLPESLDRLRQGVQLNDGMTQPAVAELINEPPLWPRNPPIRQRAKQSTSWLSLVLTEGRNRQVRRMTAALGHPTLRLIRHRIAHWCLDDIKPGHYRRQTLHLPTKP